MLARAGMTRFVGVTDADYDPIRRMWRRAARLEPWVDADEDADEDADAQAEGEREAVRGAQRLA